jgi:O-antigen ligase
MCGGVLTAWSPNVPMSPQTNNLEINMYIGGGILGLILVVALILFVLRRV